MPNNPTPTPEALEAARATIEDVQAQWLANHAGAPAGAEFYPVPIVNVLVRELFARALDAFAQAAVERERERCASTLRTRKLKRRLTYTLIV